MVVHQAGLDGAERARSRAGRGTAGWDGRGGAGRGEPAVVAAAADVGEEANLW
jgi:hypothetical protein